MLKKQRVNTKSIYVHQQTLLPDVVDAVSPGRRGQVAHEGRFIHTKCNACEQLNMQTIYFCFYSFTRTKEQTQEAYIQALSWLCFPRELAKPVRAGRMRGCTHVYEVHRGEQSCRPACVPTEIITARMELVMHALPTDTHPASARRVQLMHHHCDIGQMVSACLDKTTLCGAP